MVKPMISFRETKIRNVEFSGTTPWAFSYSACTTQPLGCLHGSTSCLTANCKQAAALSHVRTTRVFREKQLKGIARWSDLSLRVFLVQISSQSLHTTLGCATVSLPSKYHSYSGRKIPPSFSYFTERDERKTEKRLSEHVQYN